jgi:selenide,water dikinase
LLELCEGSKLSARVKFSQIPVIDGVKDYIDKKAIPGGTLRNWKSYGEKIGPLSEDQKMILCDPQTSGGLLVAVSAESVEEFKSLSNRINQKIWEIGELTEEKSTKIEVL